MTAPTEITLQDQIRELVVTVAQQRIDVQLQKAAIASKREVFETSIEKDVAECKAAATVLAANEETLKLLTVTNYGTTKDTKPAPGIKVQVPEVIKYDRAEAFAWAQERKICVVPESLDEAAFEAVAKSMRKSTPIPFVTFEEAPKATIATDLAKAIADAVL